MDDKKLNEVYRLVKENNRILKSQQRSAWIGFVFRMIMWAVAIIVPLYIYFTFFAPVIQELSQSIGAMQAAGSQFGAQAGEFGAAFSNLEGILDKFPTFGSE